MWISINFDLITFTWMGSDIFYWGSRHGFWCCSNLHGLYMVQHVSSTFSGLSQDLIYYLTKYKEIISFRQSHYCVTNIIYFAQSSNKPISTIYHCKNIIKPNDKVLLVQSPINLTPYAPSSHISLVFLFTLTDCLKYQLGKLM